MYALPTAPLAKWSLTGALTTTRTLAIAGAGITALELASGVCAILAVGAFALHVLAPKRRDDQGYVPYYR